MDQIIEIIEKLNIPILMEIMLAIAVIILFKLISPIVSKVIIKIITPKTKGKKELMGPHALYTYEYNENYFNVIDTPDKAYTFTMTSYMNIMFF